MTHRLPAVLGADAIPQVDQLVVGELDVPAGLDADHVVARGLAVDELVVRLLGVEERLGDDPRLLQELDRAVGRGLGDAVVALPHLEHQLLDLEDGSKGWRAEVEAEDESGDAADIRYTWYVNDRMTSQRKSEFSTSELKRGDQVFVEVVARIGSDESRPLRSGTLGIANSAPEIKSIPTGLTSEGIFRYRLVVEDPDGDRDLRFALEEGPSGMQMSPRGEVQWDPTVDQAGDHQVILSVTDDRGGKATQEFVLPVRVSTDAGNDGPAAIE